MRRQALVLGVLGAVSLLGISPAPSGGAALGQLSASVGGSGGNINAFFNGGGGTATRRRQFIASANTGRPCGRHWPPTTVAQDKRDARKARNRKRNKR